MNVDCCSYGLNAHGLLGEYRTVRVIQVDFLTPSNRQSHEYERGRTVHGRAKHTSDYGRAKLKDAEYFAP